MQILYWLLLFGAIAGALLVFAPSRGEGRPLSERLVLRLLLLAAWLEHVATAWDAAIVRYRLERALLCIEMQSTSEREGRARQS